MADLVIQSDGFSIGMTDFSKQYRDWIKKQKQSVETAMKRWMRVYGAEVQRKAKHNTPEFDEEGYGNNPSSLTNSIIVTEVEDLMDKLRISIGVADTWSSNYETWYEQKWGVPPPWGVAGPDLAIFLHENWSAVAGERAFESAARKEGRYGSIVGDRFLARAAEDASDPRGLAVTARQIFQETVRGR